MTDITERLRAVIPYQGKSKVAFLCHEAADTIEALRAELAARDAKIANWIWLWSQARETELSVEERETADILARAVYSGAYRSETAAAEGGE